MEVELQSQSPILGFIGFGEASYHLCKGLKSDGIQSIYSFDKMHDHNEIGPLLDKKSQEVGVKLVTSLEELAQNSEIIFCATSAKFAVAIAEEISPSLNQNHIYVDLNSASPGVKRKISEIITKANARFVDGAVMEPVPPNGHRVPIKLSGNGSKELNETMRKYGMVLDVVNELPGSASAFKMSRSIFVKGFTALLLETLQASHRFGIEEEILESISTTLHSKPLNELADLLITRTAIHAERRVTEMNEVIDTLNEIHVDPAMATQTKHVLQTIVDKDLKGYFENQVPPHYQDVVKALTIINQKGEK